MDKLKEKTVTVRLPRENREQDDKIVWVNENRYVVRRGVDVDVPESVALILQNEESMLEQMYEYREKTRKG